MPNMHAEIIDEDSPIPFEPDLSDEYDTALSTIFDRIVRYLERSERILKRERDKIERSLGDEPSEDITRYLAGLEILLDLLEINYHPGNKDGQRVIYPPDTDRFSKNQKNTKNSNVIY